ncbi:MAG: glycosyltransferase [bacterium]
MVTDYPFVSDLVRKYKVGIVIPPDDASALVKAVTELYENPEYANELGINGRRAAEKYHSWDIRAKDTFDVIQRSINKKF